MEKTILVSAGDAITAKLVQEAGFSGIWVSGFEVTARLGLPDNGSLTLTEMLRACEPMVRAVKLPIYVDCDIGYGNLKRTIREFENIGIAGICVEDNLPECKQNSLWGDKCEIMGMERFAEKISIPHKLKLIGRTEALIRGYSMDEAIKRGQEYSLAGADIVLIHTRDKIGNEAMEVSKQLCSSIPLAIVPTKFPQFTNQRLFDMGYSMVIWANQGERVKIKSIRQMLRVLKRCDCALPIEGEFAADLEDMKGLIDEG